MEDAVTAYQDGHTGAEGMRHLDITLLQAFAVANGNIIVSEITVAGKPVKVIGESEPRTLRPAAGLHADWVADLVELVGIPA